MKRFLAQGGLGNQLFVFAAALEAAESLNERVSVLTLSNRKDSILDLEKNWKVKVERALLHDKYFEFVSIVNHKFPEHHFTSKLNRKTKIAQNVYSQFSLDELKEGNFFVGFFQNHLIVQKAWPTLEKILDRQFMKYESKVKSVIGDEPYSLFHVRRGDYKLNRGNFGLLSYDYYERFLPQVEQPVVISTDDAEVTHELQARFKEAKVLGPEILNSWGTLTLMCRSSCLVSANSTLSWWAAFYLSKRNMHSYIPEPWFKQMTENAPRLNYLGAKQVRSIFE